MRRHATLWASLILIAAAGYAGCGAPSRDVKTAGSDGTVDQIALPSPTTKPQTLMIAAPPAEGEASSNATAAAEEAPIATGGGAFSMAHGDAGRTGFSDARSVASPVIRWRAKVGIQGWLNAPVIAGDVVLVPTSGTSHNSADPADGLVALRLDRGTEVWRAHFNNDANGAAVAGDKAFATSDDGNVYALELQSGKVVWKRRGVGKMYSTPLVLEDRVVVGDSSGALRAFAMKDGAPLWQVQLTGSIRGGASADGARIYAVSQHGDAVAVQADGRIVWKKSLTRPGFGGGAPEPIEAYSPPVLTPVSVIITFARDTTYESPGIMALDKKTGAVQWEARGQPGMTDWGNIRSTPALTPDGTLVYAEPYSGDVAGINSRDGSVKFRRTVGPCFFPQWASPAATADLVYVPRFDGALYAVRPDSGRPSWQLYLGDEGKVSLALPSSHRTGGCTWNVPSGSPLYSPPAIAPDGTIIIGNGQGFVFAITDSTRP